MPSELQLVSEQTDPGDHGASTPQVPPRKRGFQTITASKVEKTLSNLMSPHQEISTVETNGDEDLSSSDSSGGPVLLLEESGRSSTEIHTTDQVSSRSLLTSFVSASDCLPPKVPCKKRGRSRELLRESQSSQPIFQLILCSGAKLLWKVLLVCVHMCGMGRDWKSCFTVRQILWLQLNMKIVNDLVCCDADCEAHQHSADTLHVDPCEVLHCRRQEPPLLWDIFQKILFISSRGTLIAERHGALTEDDHLLILHRIRPVPETVRNRLVRFEDVSLATLLLYYLQRFFLRRGPQRTHNADLNPAPLRTRSEKPLYLFQHGLCESAVNWILPTMTTDIGDARTTATRWMARRLWQALWRELTTLYVAAHRLLQGRQPFQVRGETAVEAERMSESFPLRLALDSMLANNGKLEAEIWFLNTRGNAFSDVLSRNETRPPEGCRSRPMLEIMRDALKRSSWTHHDMALLDLEAIFAKLASTYYPDAGDLAAAPPLRPVIVAFSQGSAIFLLNVAYRRLVREGLVRSKIRLTPMEPKGMVLLSPPLVLKTWRSPVVSPAETRDEMVALPDQLDEGGPSDSVFGEAAVQRMKQFVELMKEKRKGTPSVWLKLRKGDYTASWLFFFFIYKYMTILLPLMEVAGAWVPSCFMTWAEVMVRRGLGFHLGMLPAGCAKWFYKLTPNGSTSVENLSLWRARMESGLPLGANFLDSTSPWHEFNDTDAEYIPLVLSSAIEACPVHIVLGSDDPMVDSAKSIDLVRAQYPQAVVESVPLNPLLLTRNNQIANEESGRRLSQSRRGRIRNARLGVKLMQGRSHLDFVWPGPALTNIYKDISACMDLWHKQSAHKSGRATRCKKLLRQYSLHGRVA